MDDLPICGDGGWTLTMKIDGKTSNLNYNSEYWTNKEPLNAEKGLGLNDDAAKLPTYWSTPLTKICLGMKSPGQSTKWIKLRLHYTATSLLTVITDDDKKPFVLLGATKWRDILAPTTTLKGQYNEGVNVVNHGAEVRLGIAGYDNNTSLDDYLGVGTFGWHTSEGGVSCGYGQAGRSRATKNPAFCYIFVQ
ncbi:hypothetical protein QZH41_010575 [Actinostola sp. cb2023]|nr:hypothetical protein QZH41_010575 [Actinostola sp. cb2023]